MSKIYNVRFNGMRATVKIVCNLGEEIVIKSLVANNAEELWQGLMDLDSIHDKGQTLEFVKTFNKTEESINLAKAIAEWEALGNEIKKVPMKAIAKWEALGNEIKKVPMNGKKLVLSEREQDDIIDLVDDLDLGLL